MCKCWWGFPARLPFPSPSSPLPLPREEAACLEQELIRVACLPIRNGPRDVPLLGWALANVVCSHAIEELDSPSDDPMSLVIIGEGRLDYKPGEEPARHGPDPGDGGAVVAVSLVAIADGPLAIDADQEIPPEGARARLLEGGGC